MRSAASSVGTNPISPGSSRASHLSQFDPVIACLLIEGIRPFGQWNHQFVQAQFVGLLINQRKRYDTELRRVLADNQSLRDKADYRPEFVTATQASRALRRTRQFVTAIRQRGGVAQ
jgi:uncharacterized protein (UPF0332 family)